MTERKDPTNQDKKNTPTGSTQNRPTGAATNKARDEKDEQRTPTDKTKMEDKHGKDQGSKK